MKPFDLEAAKRGEPIITRDGRAVKFIVQIPDADEGHRVMVLPSNGIPVSHYEDGRYNEDRHAPCSRDLFMAPRKRTVWVNLYDGPWMHNTEEEADAQSNPGRLGGKAHPIEIEE